MVKTRSDYTMIVPFHIDEVLNQKELDGVFPLIKNADKSTAMSKGAW